MVQAVVNLTDYVDRVLNIVKAKHGFKRKDEAVNFIVQEYAGETLEPELRPEFVHKIKEIERRGKFREYSSLKELRARIEHA